MGCGNSKSSSSQSPSEMSRMNTLHSKNDVISRSFRIALRSEADAAGLNQLEVAESLINNSVSVYFSHSLTSRTLLERGVEGCWRKLRRESVSSFSSRGFHVRMEFGCCSSSIIPQAIVRCDSLLLCS